MMSRLLLSCLTMAVLVGCNDLESPTRPTQEPRIPTAEAEKYRSQFLAEQELAGAKTVIAVRDQLASSSALSTPSTAEEAGSPSANVVVKGVVGGMPNPFGKAGSVDFPWFPKLAAFSLVDPTTAAEFADSDHQHAEGEECIWCTRTAEKLADTVATITFHDDADTIIAQRADTLLGIEEGATVVVEGRATLELGSLKVVAQRVYIHENQ